MSAFEDVRVVLGAIVALILTALGLWRRASKTATDVAGDTYERRRMTDAMAEAKAAREEAHKTSNDMMQMQRRMGELEADNRNCHAMNEELKTRMKQLEDRVEFLTKRKTFTRTDAGQSEIGT